MSLLFQDTSVHNENLYLSLLQRVAPGDKVARSFALTSMTRQLFYHGIINNTGSGDIVAACVTAGIIPEPFTPPILCALTEDMSRMASPGDFSTPLADVTRKLVAAGLPYIMGGSLASSAQGIPRSTNDIDLLISVEDSSAQRRLSAMLAHLGDDYLVSGDYERVAVTHEILQILHTPSFLKFDLFVSDGRPFDTQQFLRRVEYDVLLDGNVVHVYLNTPEDILLVKLEWFLKGGCVSERQWNDILGVVAIQGLSLDREYLQIWAVPLHVSALLKSALRQEPYSLPAPSDK